MIGSRDQITFLRFSNTDSAGTPPLQHSTTQYSTTPPSPLSPAYDGVVVDAVLFVADCYLGDWALNSGFRFMEIDFQAIQTDELKSRIGELRRYL
jgi:hypothetical protein